MPLYETLFYETQWLASKLFIYETFLWPIYKLVVFYEILTDFENSCFAS